MVLFFLCTIGTEKTTTPVRARGRVEPPVAVKTVTLATVLADLHTLMGLGVFLTLKLKINNAGLAIEYTVQGSSSATGTRRATKAAHTPHLTLDTVKKNLRCLFAKGAFTEINIDFDENATARVKITEPSSANPPVADN